MDFSITIFIYLTFIYEDSFRVRSFLAFQLSVLNVNLGLKLPSWESPTGAKFLFSRHLNAVAFTAAHKCSAHISEI